MSMLTNFNIISFDDFEFEAPGYRSHKPEAINLDNLDKLHCSSNFSFISIYSYKMFHERKYSSTHSYSLIQ